MRNKKYRVVIAVSAKRDVAEKKKLYSGTFSIPSVCGRFLTEDENGHKPIRYISNRLCGYRFSIYRI